jgi:hypothetical protein
MIGQRLCADATGPLEVQAMDMSSHNPPSAPSRTSGHVISAHDQIVRALAQEILTGALAPGDKLPLEADLLGPAGDFPRQMPPEGRPEGGAKAVRRSERDAHGNEIRFENSTGYWDKRERDAHGNLIYYETSTGYWSKREYDAHGNEIYWENSNGKIIDKRPKVVELTLQEIADKMGIKVEQLRIKD